jgi:hypothetical protein
MKMIQSYNKTDLCKLAKTPYSRIWKDSDLYIPIKIENAQSRATAKWYTIRYIMRKDIIKYFDDNPAKITYWRMKDKIIKKHLKK